MTRPPADRLDLNKLRTQVLADNTAQSVLNHLKKLKSRQRDVSRWIWELMQNARDASRDSQGSLTTSVIQSADSVIFEHNGGSFTPKEVMHLIYHGSTKAETEDAIGQYGSGFLSTHLLSPKIRVSGRLTDGCGFSFSLERSLTSVDEMSNAMKKAYDDFEKSLSPDSQIAVTRFEYPVSPDAKGAIAEGIAQLRHCAPYVLAFNRDFSRICVRTPEEQIDYSVTSRTPDRSFDHVTQVTVTETTHDTSVERRYLLAQSDGTMVALPIESMRVVPLGPIPRLFVGFPLVGTEDFSFPAVINSLSFTATDDRDGVYLGDTNSTNRNIIHKACDMHVKLLRCVSSEGVRDAHILATFPSVQKREWLDDEWLSSCLADLISTIRRTPILRTCTGSIVCSVDATVPLVEDGDVTELWQLLHRIHDLRERLVCQEESTGWATALKSWYGLHKAGLDEVYDGHALIQSITEKSGRTEENGGTVAQMRRALDDNSEGTVSWLSRCHKFLRSVGLGEHSENYHIVPSQDGTFRRLNDLYRDKGVDDDLKKIAQLLDWDLELRDQEMKSLDHKPGRGDRDSEDVATGLVKRVKNVPRAADVATEARCMKASACLFGWLVGQQKWHWLDGFVVHSREDPAEAIRLGGGEKPLAPLDAWEPVAREFADLFPDRHILAEEFFAVVPDAGAWKELDERDIVRRELLIQDRRKTDALHPEEETKGEDHDHESEDEVSVTEVAYMQVRDVGIMNRVRKSRSLAYRLWCFLTDYVMVEKKCMLEQRARCECGEDHRYVVASWLKPVRDNRWISRGKGNAGKANAQSIAELLREGGGSDDHIWDTLRDSRSGTCKLLDALGVAPTDVMKEWDPGAAGRLDKWIREMLALARGDVERLQEAREVMEERVAKREAVRRNQRLGQCVELDVQRCLEGAGFDVQPRHEGADLEITLGDSGRLAVIREERVWLVEIKATRGNVVRMSRAQAGEAVDRGNRYLLCVVPIAEEDTPTSGAVRSSMRFVENIGLRLIDLVQGANRLDEERGKLVSGENQGVRLEVEHGVERFRISAQVWADGFPIGELLDRLLCG